jgi:hypothetical protein
MAFRSTSPPLSPKRMSPSPARTATPRIEKARVARGGPAKGAPGGGAVMRYGSGCGIPEALSTCRAARGMTAFSRTPRVEPGAGRCGAGPNPSRERESDGGARSPAPWAGIIRLVVDTHSGRGAAGRRRNAGGLHFRAAQAAAPVGTAVRSAADNRHAGAGGVRCGARLPPSSAVLWAEGAWR